jgi:hypothetical protein
MLAAAKVTSGPHVKQFPAVAIYQAEFNKCRGIVISVPEL